MDYGFVITTAGWNLLANLVAGEPLVLTRVMVGKGKVPTGVQPETLTNLITPVAQASSTIPVVNRNNTSFVVEYRNNMNGGLREGFWLNEFGVFANNRGSEVLLYYATLGDYPQYVSPISTGGIDVRRFPVSITLTDEINVTISYPAISFMTAEAVAEEIADSLALHNDAPASHPKLIRDISVADQLITWLAVHGRLNKLNSDWGDEIKDVTLTNSATPWPWNNSKAAVSLARARNNTKYTVLHEVTAHSGGSVGDIEISERAHNGFKIAFTGSATSVTLRLWITGGVIG